MGKVKGSEYEKELEEAGWKTGDAADFLEMSEEERQLLDTRVMMAKAIRRGRELLCITQKELAKKLKSTQPRVARIEKAAGDVSLDQLVRAVLAVGGRLTIDTTFPTPKSTKKTARQSKRSRPRQRPGSQEPSPIKSSN